LIIYNKGFNKLIRIRIYIISLKIENTQIKMSPESLEPKDLRKKKLRNLVIIFSVIALIATIATISVLSLTSSETTSDGNGGPS
jgi:hypothetical protein